MVKRPLSGMLNGLLRPPRAGSLSLEGEGGRACPAGWGHFNLYALMSPTQRKIELVRGYPTRPAKGWPPFGVWTFENMTAIIMFI